MSDKEKFKKALIKLCQKHKLAPVPTYDNKPNAHDCMLIVPLDEFWLDYYQNRIYTSD